MQTFLREADDYSVVHLADGNQVHVYGDGRVYLFQKQLPLEYTVINLYTVKEEEADAV